MLDLNGILDGTSSQKAMLRRVILVYCGDLDVKFVITVFDPSIRSLQKKIFQVPKELWVLKQAPDLKRKSTVLHTILGPMYKI